MLTRQFSPKVAHKGRDKEKITAIYCLWMVDTEWGRVEVKKKTTLRLKLYIQYEVSVRLLASVCMNRYFHRLLISSYHMHIRSLFIN